MPITRLWNGSDSIAIAYNQALEETWLGSIDFYIPEDDSFVSGGVRYHPNETHSKHFEFHGVRSVNCDWQYKIVTVKYIWIDNSIIDQFQEHFFTILSANSEFVRKFEDSRLLEIRKQFFEEMYKIEIWLRELISFMFYTTYESNQNLLNWLEIKLQDRKSYDKLLRDYENEFFHIAFWGYTKLLNIDKNPSNELYSILQDGIYFKPGIVAKPYVRFIESIKKDLDTLNNTRNEIMHHRTFWKKTRENYGIASKNIHEKIIKFKENYMHMFDNNLWLFVWERYEYIWPTSENYIHWHKYKLVEIVFSDAIFQWETEKDSIPRFDKDFNLYRKYDPEVQTWHF